MTVAPKLAYSQIFEPWGWVVSTGNYIDDMQAEMEGVQKDLENTYNSLLLRIDFIFVVVVIVAVIVAFLYGKHMVKPLRKIQEFAGSLSMGDMTTEITANSNNEIGRAAESLGIAQKNMRDLLSNITSVANNVNGALEEFSDIFYNMQNSIAEVSTAVTSIADNVNSQASSTDNASDEIGTLAQQSAKSVEEITQIITELLENASKSVEVMNEMTESIDVMTTEMDGQRTKITESLNHLNGLAQDNAAVTEQTAGMSTELSGVVANSVRIVDDLKTSVDSLIENIAKFTI